MNIESTSQTTLRSCIVPRLRFFMYDIGSKKKREEVDDLLTSFIVTSNSSFLRIENIFLGEALSMSRPDYVPPNRVRISKNAVCDMFQHLKAVEFEKLRSGRLF